MVCPILGGGPQPNHRRYAEGGNGQYGDFPEGVERAEVHQDDVDHI